MTAISAKKLGFQTRKTNFGALIIEKTFLKPYGMVVTGFKLGTSQKRYHFF